MYDSHLLFHRFRRSMRSRWNITYANYQQLEVCHKGKGSPVLVPKCDDGLRKGSTLHRLSDALMTQIVYNLGLMPSFDQMQTEIEMKLNK